nr:MULTISPECIES: nucleotidyl transferase AbiEii/AbiGii toxin family protein [unclassified Tychonema]
MYPNEQNRVIFKGGTSLSKGWKLIKRFSEDIDIFLNPDVSPQQIWGEKKIDTALKTIESKVEEHPNLQLSQGGISKKGKSRSSYYTYDQQFPGLSNRILLEIGIRSGKEPIESVHLSSFLSDFLREKGYTLDAEDESTFSMMLLHFKRTFVEKLFAIHGKVKEYQQQIDQSIDKHARHYYDLYQLAQRDEIKQLLESPDFISIKQDCDQLSKTYFKSKEFSPTNLIFANSEALFPTGDLRKAISKAYTEQCQILCYGSYPSWEEVEECFSSIRSKL